jgi:hypothetical protein
VRKILTTATRTWCLFFSLGPHASQADADY